MPTLKGATKTLKIYAVGFAVGCKIYAVGN